MSEKRLLIIGAGGHGRMVADTAETIGGWSDIAFVDDQYPGISVSGVWPVIGKLSNLQDLREYWSSVIVAIGENTLRLKLQQEASALGYSIATIIHPSAVVSMHAEIGAGSVVFANAVVNAGSRIGRSVILNTATIIEHDVVIDDGAHVSPGALLAGNVIVGRCAWVGIGASVINGLEIGPGAIVGAGASVIGDVEADTTVVGVPARPVHR